MQAQARKPYLLREENRHLWYGVVLVIYFIAFYLVEWLVPEDACFSTYIPLDDKIPFLEGFVVPYVIWMPMVVGMAAYLAWKDPMGFKRYMVFLAITLYSTLLFYALFPNRQDLRVTEFPRDNLFTWAVSMVYENDTNTNVCPSIHVIGSFAVVFAAWNCPRLRKFWMQAAIWIGSFVVAISTVFVKQHSALDLIAATVLSVAAYPLAYKLAFRKKKS